jgi:hypothetical protein
MPFIVPFSAPGERVNVTMDTPAKISAFFVSLIGLKEHVAK